MKPFRAEEVNLSFSKDDWVYPQDPTFYGKVAVLMGGSSPESGISLQSGETIVTSLREAGVDAHALVVDEGLEWLDVLRHGGFERAAIALHGSWGEEGQCQAVLETLGIPYTGSDMLASALALNKTKAKAFFLQHHIKSPFFTEINPSVTGEQLFAKIKGPIAIKPASQGSTMGVSRIDSAAEFEQALETAKQYDEKVFAEEWIQGQEYTVCILGKQVLPSLKINSPSEYYDFEAKYVSNETRIDCPSDLSPQQELVIRNTALSAYRALGCSGWASVDMIRDKKGLFWVLEVNTIPSLTSRSLFPLAAAAANFTLQEMCLAILASSLEEATLTEWQVVEQENEDNQKEALGA